MHALSRLSLRRSGAYVSLLLRCAPRSCSSAPRGALESAELRSTRGAERESMPGLMRAWNPQGYEFTLAGREWREDVPVLGRHTLSGVEKKLHAASGQQVRFVVKDAEGEALAPHYVHDLLGKRVDLALESGALVPLNGGTPVEVEADTAHATLLRGRLYLAGGLVAVFGVGGAFASAFW